MEITKEYHTISSFPTNFFKTTYKQFVNTRPIIGIVPMALDSAKIIVENPSEYMKEYFGASFVKLIEMAGGRAIPLNEVFQFKFISLETFSSLLRPKPSQN